MQPGVCGAKRSTPSLAGASLLLARSLSTFLLLILSPLILSLLILSPLILCLGCGSTPPLDSAPSQQASADLGAAPARKFSERIASFSADRAWRDLRALTEVGARPVGSRGNDRARDYLRAELEDLGVEVESWEVDYANTEERSSGAGAPETRVANLSAIISGTRSQDRLISSSSAPMTARPGRPSYSRSRGALQRTLFSTRRRSSFSMESHLSLPRMTRGRFTGRSAAWGWPRAFKQRASPEFAR